MLDFTLWDLDTRDMARFHFYKYNTIATLKSKVCLGTVRSYT